MRHGFVLWVAGGVDSYPARLRECEALLLRARGVLMVMFLPSSYFPTLHASARLGRAAGRIAGSKSWWLAPPRGIQVEIQTKFRNAKLKLLRGGGVTLP